MTEYKWKINALDCVPKEAELIDVVSIVYWTRLGQKYIGGKPIQVSLYGSMPCKSPSKADFTAYPDLTYDQICSWLDAGLNVDELDANLDSQIENIINPPIITLPLPFENPTKELNI
jgi:hypothetical protein